VSFIASNHRNFKKKVKAARRSSSPATRAALCAQAAIYAARNPCGIFSSWPLEECLLDLAGSISCPMAAEPDANTFLHVFSRAYSSGGHTRVAERWISASPASGAHDVVLLSQGDRPVPATLEAATRSRNGRIHNLADGLHLDKARQLRSLASRYQHIILHVHMYDILPVLAFGTSAFTRPVIFYNHADHLFWVGVSIADTIVNMRSLALHINTAFRHIAPERNKRLPLPVTQPAVPLPHETRHQLITELGLPEKAQVMLTMASPYKYAPIQGLNFLATIESILAHNSRAVLLAIGPSPQDPAWQAANQRTQGRIIPLGRLPHTEIDRYLSLADMAVDSFPFSSLVALLDIGRHNIPCLTLDTPVNGYDAFTHAGIVCATPQELIRRALKELEEPSPNLLLPILEQESLPQGFARHVEAIQESFPQSHIIQTFQTDERPVPSQMELFIAHNHQSHASGIKHHLSCFIQECVYLCLRYISPCLIPRPVYRRLESYGII